MHTSAGPLPTTPSTAVEEEQEPEVINTTDIIDSHHHYQDITNKQVGWMCMFILIKIKLIITGIDISQVHQLITGVI